MRRVIFARIIGGDKESLSTRDKLKLKSMMKKIESRIGEKSSFLILFATEPLAQQNAEALSQMNFGNYQPLEALCMSEESEQKLEEIYLKVKELGKTSDAENIIVLTHVLYCRDLPLFFFEKMYSKKTYMNFNLNQKAWMLKEGQAWLMDCMYGKIYKVD
ncbi:MAG: hypothetical protein V4439_02490 [Patescibacteria group bacterium]